VRTARRRPSTPIKTKPLGMPSARPRARAFGRKRRNLSLAQRRAVQRVMGLCDFREMMEAMINLVLRSILYTFALSVLLAVSGRRGSPACAPARLRSRPIGKFCHDWGVRCMRRRTSLFTLVALWLFASGNIALAGGLPSKKGPLSAECPGQTCSDRCVIRRPQLKIYCEVYCRATGQRVGKCEDDACPIPCH
jgi:hypothetical protein